MIPAQEWWSIIEAYGARIWPAQIVFYIVALLLIVWFFLKPGHIQSWVSTTFFPVVGYRFFKERNIFTTGERRVHD